MTQPSLRFEFILARDLGMTHARLLDEMSSTEFQQWAAFYRAEARNFDR